MTRVLVISHDVVGSRMAGPGIRYWEIAGALSRRHETTLACPNRTDLEGRGFQLTSYRRGDLESLRELAETARVLVISGDSLDRFPWLGESGKPIVVDLYDPFVLENLEMDRSLSAAEQSASQESGLRVLKGLIEAGDFFLCANLRQRDFWLGMLAAWGRLTPVVYQADPSLESLITEVPFGLPADPPLHTKQVLKGAWPGIGPEDKVVLWGGGLWDWLDPVTAVHAMKWVGSRRADVRLFFMGTRHPNHESVPEMKAAIEATRLSEELGLLGTQVFFNEWVPYHERADYLLEADLGISLNRDLVETRFSSRTRLLDCFWAGLPVVVTGGDPLAEQVSAKGLGLVVGYSDAEGAGSAILQLLERPRLREELSPRFQEVASSLRWDSVCAPLLRFCDQPRLFSHRRADWPAGGPPAGGRGALSRAISRIRGIGAGTRHGT
ncbi:MAG: glycosyltransferase family 4 protein [Dehalococcoidia bacterium]|nr:glycosyltransferase family 4 protein [Dehalococcoidia bacterium]